jgi:hypothetical protein
VPRVALHPRMRVQTRNKHVKENPSLMPRFGAPDAGLFGTRRNLRSSAGFFTTADGIRRSRVRLDRKPDRVRDVRVSLLWNNDR